MKIRQLDKNMRYLKSLRKLNITSIKGVDYDSASCCLYTGKITSSQAIILPTKSKAKMVASARSLDDLLHRVLSHLLGMKRFIQGTRGNLVEVTGALLTLRNPRARLSRTIERGKLFSGLGELMWYLSATRDAEFIKYYIPKYKKDEENGIIWGGYGPRILEGETNQLTNIVKLLKHNPSSKRAVVQIFHAEDIKNDTDSDKRHKDVPCTCSLQFLIRNSKLNLITYMRSNDAVLGLPHDVFTFTMLQEIVARSIGVEIGFYKHCVGSLHLYRESFENAKDYIKEGWQPTIPMPPMSFGPQERYLPSVLKVEAAIRLGARIPKQHLASLDPYWHDIVTLLQIYRARKGKRYHDIPGLKSKMNSQIFNPYIRRKQRPSAGTLTQKELPLEEKQ